MPKVGLVLSGGFAKGAYQVGALKALQEYIAHDQITCTSASSVGALNAYAFLTGNIELINDIWLRFDFKNFKSFARKYISRSFTADIIKEIVGDGSSPPNNTYITCFNISKLELNYINLADIKTSDVEPYLQASVTMPMLTHAINISGNRYVDGGLIDNVPVKPLANHKLDYSIVISFENNNWVFENEAIDNRLIKINLSEDNFIKNSLSFDKESVAHMIKLGYTKTSAILADIFANGIDNCDMIQSKIKTYNAQNGNSKFRLTGDVIVGNINKLMKKIISHKI